MGPVACVMRSKFPAILDAGFSRSEVMRLGWSCIITILMQ